MPSRGKGSCSFHEAWAKFGRNNEHFQPRLDSASHRLPLEVSSLNQCKENLVPHEHESQYFLPGTAHARSKALSSSLPHSWFPPLATLPLCPDESPIWHLWQDGEEVHPHFFRQQGLKFPPNSICIPARDSCLTVPSFLNPPALLSLPNTHQCPASPRAQSSRGRGMHGAADCSQHFPPWGVAAAETELQLREGQDQHGVLAHRCGGLALCSGISLLLTRKPSSLHQEHAQCGVASHPAWRGRQGEDGKLGGICRALRASRAGRLETIQFSRRCSQGHE